MQVSIDGTLSDEQEQQDQPPLLAATPWRLPLPCRIANTVRQGARKGGHDGRDHHTL